MSAGHGADGGFPSLMRDPFDPLADDDTSPRCACGNPDAYWHGDRAGLRSFCCDGCWQRDTGEVCAECHEPITRENQRCWADGNPADVCAPKRTESSPSAIRRFLGWLPSPRARVRRLVGLFESSPAVVLTLTDRQAAAVSAGLCLLASYGTLRPEDVHGIMSKSGRVEPLSAQELHTLLARVEGRPA